MILGTMYISVLISRSLKFHLFSGLLPGHFCLSIADSKLQRLAQTVVRFCKEGIAKFNSSQNSFFMNFRVDFSCFLWPWDSFSCALRTHDILVIFDIEIRYQHGSSGKEKACVSNLDMLYGNKECEYNPRQFRSYTIRSLHLQSSCTTSSSSVES